MQYIHFTKTALKKVLSNIEPEFENVKLSEITIRKYRAENAEGFEIEHFLKDGSLGMYVRGRIYHMNHDDLRSPLHNLHLLTFWEAIGQEFDFSHRSIRFYSLIDGELFNYDSDASSLWRDNK